MKVNGIVIEDTFAEAFPMKATRLVVTAVDRTWVGHAVSAMTGAPMAGMTATGLPLAGRTTNQGRVGLSQKLVKKPVK